jgi:cell division protein FtsB
VPLKRHLPTALWLLAVAGLCTAAAVDPRGWRRNLKQRGDVQALEAKNATMAEENQRLSREARALKTDPAAMERAVRAELGFVHPGEMVMQLHAAEATGSTAAHPPASHP